jgi:hypothetical protein
VRWRVEEDNGRFGWKVEGVEHQIFRRFYMRGSISQPSIPSIPSILSTFKEIIITFH